MELLRAVAEPARVVLFLLAVTAPAGWLLASIGSPGTAASTVASPVAFAGPMGLPTASLTSPLVVFPLSAATTFRDSFGDPRPNGRIHAGQDLSAPKMTPVRAVADGIVRWVHDAPNGEGKCCAVELVHQGGWRTRYIHLNNDTPGTDDGLAIGVAPGLGPGVVVEAGQVIGWVGDSGNAEDTGPHLHFELRDAEGRPVNVHERLAELASGMGVD